jgi:hypothetical protein
MAKEDPKKLLKEIGEEALEIQNSISSIAGKLKNNIKEFNAATKDTQKIFNSTLSASENLGKKLAEINADSLKSSKERKSLEDQLIKNAKEIVSLERERDKAMRNALSAKGKEKAVLLKIAGLLGDAVTYSKEQVANAERLTKLYINIEKNLGLTGKILEGINKIPILNKFIDVKKALEAANEEASKLTGNRWSVLGAALKSLGSSLKKNLTDPLVILGAAGGIISGLVKLFNEFDKIAVDIGRNFGTTPENARKTANEFSRIAASSSNILSTTSNLIEAFTDLNAIAGTYANFSQETLETYNNLVKGLGLSKESAITQYKFSVLQGKSFKEISTQLAGQITIQKSQNKLALSDKEIYESITKTTAIQRLNIKGGAEGLVKAVIEAKKLGAEFGQLESAANSLLQFEDSISSELEAELLTNQNLNLERARAYALNNDIAGVAKEINRQGITYEKFIGMNRIQQEAIAKALGFQRDEFGQMLENQKMLNVVNKLGAKDVNDLAAQYAKAADKEAFLAKIGDEKLKSQVQNITFQEKLNNLLEKAKTIFVAELQPLFESLLNRFDKFIKGGGIQKIADIAKGVAESLMSIGKFLAGPIKNVLLGLAGLVAIKSLSALFRGIPVRVVGMSPMGGMGGGFMSNFYQKGTPSTGGLGWNAFQKSVAGQGLSKQQVSQMYLAQKGGTPGTSGRLTGMGTGMIGLGATMAGEAIGGTAGSLLSGAGQGAMIGSMAGPWGALIGGIGGLAVSGIKIMNEMKAQRINEDSFKALQPKNETQRRAMRLYSNMASTDETMSRYSSISGAGSEGVDKTNMILEKISGQLSEQRDFVVSGNKLGSIVGGTIYNQS